MRKLIRNFLRRRGYDIIKTGVPYIPETRDDVTITVAGFSITMPGNNVQHINYRIYPDLNAQLARLAGILYSKYPDMTIVDVGANVGDTIAVLRSVTNAPIIGVEGDDASYGYLDRNMKQFKDVYIVKTFLSDRRQELKVDFGSEGWNNTIKPSEKGKEVAFTTLDVVVESPALSNKLIKLLKVDVEGYDTIVLRGASQIIQRHKPALFFEYNRAAMNEINEDGLSTIFSLAGYGYNRLAFFDHKGTLVLSTTLHQKEVISCLDAYASSSKNLLGYYDICIFHEQDNDIAEVYLQAEKKFV